MYNIVLQVALEEIIWYCIVLVCGSAIDTGDLGEAAHSCNSMPPLATERALCHM